MEESTAVKLSITVTSHGGLWTAWWEDEPNITADGSDPAKAVDRLLRLKERRLGYTAMRFLPDIRPAD